MWASKVTLDEWNEFMLAKQVVISPEETEANMRILTTQEPRTTQHAWKIFTDATCDKRESWFGNWNMG